jgi:DNA primase
VALSVEHVQRIKNASSLTAVIGESVSLRKSGPRHIGLCPFHQEKTPSFSVSEEKGLYYCFGCHAGGDVFSFIMRHQGVDFHAAASFLASRAGIVLDNVPPEEQLKREKEKQLVHANTLALRFFTQALLQPAAQTARAYLRERGVTRTEVSTWGMGYGGEEGACLIYLKEQGLSLETLFEAGLLTESRERCLFDKKIVFPIHNPLGQLVGFGARKIAGEGPKYVNTRESAVFSKRALLYGWRQSEHTLRTQQQVVLVEGYLDVIAAHRAGVTQAVAALGTAFTPQHAALCARLAKEAVVLLDSDAAGTRGSIESTLKLLQQGLKVKIATLPHNEDPDSWVRKAGTESFKQAVQQATPALEHAIAQAFAKTSLSIEEKVHTALGLQPLLSALQNGLERDLYTAHIAQRVGVSPEQLKKHLKLTPQAKPAHPTTPTPTAAPALAVSSLSKSDLDLMREIFLFPEIIEKSNALSEYVLNDTVRVFLDDLAQQRAPVPSLIEEHFKNDPSAQQILLKYHSSPALSLPEQERSTKAAHVFEKMMHKLKYKHLDMALQDVLRELHETEARGQATDELLRRKQELTNRKRVLKEKFNSV